VFDRLHVARDSYRPDPLLATTAIRSVSVLQNPEK